MVSTKSRTMPNAGRAATTAPNPTRLATLSAGSTEALAPASKLVRSDGNMPSMRSQASSRRRSSTPQVNAPCAPPPCNARSTRTWRPLPSVGDHPGRRYVLRLARAQWQHAQSVLLLVPASAKFCPCMLSRKSTTPCKAKVPRLGARRYSAASRGAISGLAENRIARKQPAISATPILSALMGRAAEGFRYRKVSSGHAGRGGAAIQERRLMSC